MSKLLLLSNSTMPGEPFFDWVQPYFKEFMKGIKGPIAFVPYAAVGLSYDDYEEKLQSALKEQGMQVQSVHRLADKQAFIARASAIAVGGGNTFALLHMLYEEGLMSVITESVNKGLPYIGWSAGANLACPTIKTTNDMPIVQPLSFEALNLVPFQINPHFTTATIPGHGGEGRVDRINEFLTLHQDKYVLGLPEGMLIERHANALTLKGSGEAALFRSNENTRYVQGGTDLSFLL